MIKAGFRIGFAFQRSFRIYFVSSWQIHFSLISQIFAQANADIQLTYAMGWRVFCLLCENRLLQNNGIREREILSPLKRNFEFR